MRREDPNTAIQHNSLPFPERVAAFLIRSHYVLVVSLAILVTALRLAFPMPSMADHFNSRLHYLLRDLTRPVFLTLMVAAAALAFTQSARRSVRFRAAAIVCLIFALLG